LGCPIPAKLLVLKLSKFKTPPKIGGYPAYCDIAHSAVRIPAMVMGIKIKRTIILFAVVLLFVNICDVNRKVRSSVTINSAPKCRVSLPKNEIMGVIEKYVDIKSTTASAEINKMEVSEIVCFIFLELFAIVYI